MMEASALDFKQLNYFVTVYKTANFTSAASQLHISQQGLSNPYKIWNRNLVVLSF